MVKDSLILHAIEAQKQASAHRSGYKVGAVILANHDNQFEYFTGFNVEFDTLTTTIHAEIMAILQALAGGYKKENIQAIAVKVTDDCAWFPCGICRQALYECNPEMYVIATNANETKEAILKDLIPDCFRREE